MKVAPHAGLKLSPRNPALPDRHNSESDNNAGVNEAYGAAFLLLAKITKKSHPYVMKGAIII